MIGERKLTGAERFARWRKKHAAKLARKAARRGGHKPCSLEDMMALRVTPDDWRELFLKVDEV